MVKLYRHEMNDIGQLVSLDETPQSPDRRYFRIDSHLGPKLDRENLVRDYPQGRHSGRGFWIGTLP